ncbi:unnamed protein product [Gadus morhua 'NCC']
MTTQVESAAALRVPESEARLEAFPQSRTPSSGRASTKGWQYSDHMENINGYLMKYTNLVTGWQYRFFVLNNEAGMLEYFVNEQSRPQKPRGTLPLAGAVISPSDEDSHTFTVNAISGEQYKLRATDAKERQHWSQAPSKSRSFSTVSQGSGSSPLAQRRASQTGASSSYFSLTQAHKGSSLYSSRRSLLPDHLLDAREMMVQAQDQHKDLIQTIEGLPPVPGCSPLDQDLLMLKATSMATMTCLHDCLHILQLQQLARHHSALAGPNVEWLEPKMADILKNGGSGGSLGGFSTNDGLQGEGRLELSTPESCSFSGELEEVDAEEEVEDSFVEREEELGAVEEERSVILHLLSQLKLGMDLTRVVLPTFILEKRSLLEMYADFMSTRTSSWPSPTATRPRTAWCASWSTTSPRSTRAVAAPSPRSPTTPSSGRPSSAPGGSPGPRTRPRAPPPRPPAPPPRPRSPRRTPPTRSASWRSRCRTTRPCRASTPSARRSACV